MHDACPSHLFLLLIFVEDNKLWTSSYVILSPWHLLHYYEMCHILKMIAFWDIALYSLIVVDRRFWVAYCMNWSLRWSRQCTPMKCRSTATRDYTAQYPRRLCNIHTRHRENFKSNTLLILLQRQYSCFVRLVAFKNENRNAMRTFGCCAARNRKHGNWLSDKSQRKGLGMPSAHLAVIITGLHNRRYLHTLLISRKANCSHNVVICLKGLVVTQQTDLVCRCDCIKLRQNWLRMCNNSGIGTCKAGK
jgi:hypothetical protein